MDFRIYRICVVSFIDFFIVDFILWIRNYQFGVIGGYIKVLRKVLLSFDDSIQGVILLYLINVLDLFKIICIKKFDFKILVMVIYGFLL